MIVGTFNKTYFTEVSVEHYGELAEDQWLLKLREDHDYDYSVTPRNIINSYKTGFLTKFTKKGQLPVKFKEWGNSQITNPVTNKWETVENELIYVWNESFRSGWALKQWRIGMSQEWAVVQHPEGFLLEIYLDDFLNLVLNETIEQGVIVGEFKWENSRLIKKI